MVASKTLEIPYHKGIGRQRGRCFGALAQIIGRTAILFLRKHIVPAAKRVVADLLEFAVPEVADVSSGKKNNKTAGKRWKTDIVKTTWRWQAKEKHSSQNFGAKQSVRQRLFLLKLQINIDKSKELSVPTFCCSFWESWCETPSCGQCVVFSRTRNLSNYIS